MTPKTFDDLYPKTWLDPQDLRGKTVPVIIQGVYFRDFPKSPRNPGGERETCAVLTFVGKDKHLILNLEKTEELAEATNTRSYAELAGKRIKIRAIPGRNGKPRITIEAVESPAEALFTEAQQPKEAAPAEETQGPKVTMEEVNSQFFD